MLDLIGTSARPYLRPVAAGPLEEVTREKLARGMPEALLSEITAASH
jgi:hypothetical protein